VATETRGERDVGERDGAIRVTAPDARTEIRSPGGYREVLAIPVFRRLWLAQLCSALGEALALVAMPLLAYAVTGSAGLLSVIFIIQLAPRILFAPIAGVLADRVNRRRLMVSADLGRAALVALLPFTDHAWQIAVIAALVAIGTTVARPAELAAVPMVVPPDQLVRALSASQVANSVVRVAGPALGAGLVSITGPGLAFGLQALCFLASAGFLVQVVLPTMARVSHPATGALAAARREIGVGLHVVRVNPIVRGLFAVETLWQTVVACFVVPLVVLVNRLPGLGDAADSVYALLMASFSAGTAVGALIAGRVERRIGRPRLMAIGYLAPLMLVPAGLTPPLAVLFVCWFTLGFTDAWAVIAMQAYLAEAVRDEVRGRVYATWNASLALGGATAFALVGWATPRLGPATTLAIGGALVGIGGPLLLLVTGAVAAMRRRSAPAGALPSA